MQLLPHHTLEMCDLELLSYFVFKKVAQNDPKPNDFVEILLKSTQFGLVIIQTKKGPFLMTFENSSFETQTVP